MKKVTFDEVFEEIKSKGKEEKETIEMAEELARVIKELTDARINKGFTQRDLAEKCGLKQSAIARMESLQKVPRLDTMIKVARCLDVKVYVGVPEETSVSVIILRKINYNWDTRYEFMRTSPTVMEQEYAYEKIS